LACHPEKAVRTRVAKALGTIAQLGCPTALARLAQDSEPSVQIAALRGLLRVAERAELVHETHGSAVVAVVCGRLSSGESEVRQLAIRVAVALAEALSTTDVSGDQLTSWLAENDDPAFRAAVVQLLGRRGAQKELHQLVAGSDPSLTQLAAWALNLDEAEPRELVQLLAQSDSCLRQAAVRAAAGHPDRAACRDILEQARNDSDEGVRWLAARGRSGRLDRRWAALQRGRLPSEAASAQWPFGLPAPDEDTPRRARLPVAIAAFNLSYNLNLGVLIRSAEAAGAREVLIVGKDFYHRLAAMGADKWVDVHFFATAEAMVAHARQRGYQLVAVQQSPTAERFDRADYPPRPCLVVGSEGPGLSPLLCAQADLVVEIPQRGEIDSLNVATAATLVLWACLSRRGWL
jgi:tRNA(Leu) C34 or U34 (ribose-2'-O)-methylase TrmL